MVIEKNWAFKCQSKHIFTYFKNVTPFFKTVPQSGPHFQKFLNPPLSRPTLVFYLIEVLKELFLISDSFIFCLFEQLPTELYTSAVDLYLSWIC